MCVQIHTGVGAHYYKQSKRYIWEVTYRLMQSSVGLAIYPSVGCLFFIFNKKLPADKPNSIKMIENFKKSIL